MQLVLTREQQELGSGVRKFVSEYSPPDRIRQVMVEPDGLDRELWRRMAVELGLAGLVVPERYGGSEAGYVERSVVAEELGRALVPTPFLSSAVLAVDTVLALADESVRAELLPELVNGEVIAAVAGGASGSSDEVAATWRGGTWVLDGRTTPVVAGDVADVVLVHARTEQGSGWFLVSGGAVGLTRTSLRTLDPTRRLARLDFASAPGRALSTKDAEAVLAKVNDLAAITLAAESVGGMQRVLEMTADYAKVRRQFGRAIGSYQGVKHTCAEMYCACEQACSVVRQAAWVADHEPARLALTAASTQVFLSPAYFRTAADTVQLHGGIGYTWEHDAHLYYKRAKTSELLLGTADQQRARLADLLGV